MVILEVWAAEKKQVASYYRKECSLESNRVSVIKNVGASKQVTTMLNLENVTLRQVPVSSGEACTGTQ